MQGLGPGVGVKGLEFRALRLPGPPKYPLKGSNILIKRQLGATKKVVGGSR